MLVYGYFRIAKCMFERFERQNVHEEAEFCHFGRTQVRQSKDFRPPNLPGRQAFRLPNPALERGLSSLEGLSAAEPAAESALSSLPLHVFYDCFKAF